DRGVELVWRQAARWVAGSSPDPVSIVTPDSARVGSDASIEVDVRDAAFAPIGDAEIEAAIRGPDGEAHSLKLTRSDAASGRYRTTARLDQPGLYRVSVDARKSTTALGSSVQWIYAGGVDREFADPHLNEGWLRRIARA